MAKKFKSDDAGVEAETVVAVEDYTPTGPDRESVVQAIARKHPEMHMAWVSREHTNYKHLAWKMLKFAAGATDVAETLEIDEAEKTTGNVLCWRPLKLQKHFTKTEDDRRLAFTNMVRKEGTDTQAAALSGLGLKGVKVAALHSGDN